MCLTKHPLHDHLEVNWQSIPYLVDNPSGDILVERLRDAAGNTAKRVAVSTERDTESYAAFEISTIEKCRESLWYGILA